MVEPQIFTDK